MYADGPQGVNYPALLYVLWPLGSWFGEDALRMTIKGLSIPFDLAIGLLLYLMGRRAGEWRGVLAAALYLLNPGIIIAGPFWGQIDAAGTLAFLGALVAAGQRRYALAGAAAAMAALLKPQFGLVGAVLLVTVAVECVRHAERGPLVRAAIGAVFVAVAVASPLGLTPGRYVALVREASSPWPYTSLYAFNPWGLIFGFLNPDAPYVGLGAALLVTGLVASLLPLWRQRDLPTLLAVGTFVAFAFYFLPTRVHERYLFPAFAILAPLAAMHTRLLVPYLVLSAGFTLSLVYMLSRNATATDVVAPPLVDVTVFSGLGVVGIGLSLMGAAVFIILRLVPRRSRESRDAVAN